MIGRIEDRQSAGGQVLDQPPFGGGIFSQRAVPIEMIRRTASHDRGGREPSPIAQMGKLKAAELQNNNIGGPNLLKRRQQAVADVLDNLDRYKSELDSLMTERFHLSPRLEAVVVGVGRAT